jgi:hypothetical protein
LERRVLNIIVIILNLEARIGFRRANTTLLLMMAPITIA